MIARVHLVVLVVLVAVFGTLLPSAAGAEEPVGDSTSPVRILPFGDSITHGSAGDWTWRWFLDRHLRTVGQPFDLVGPQREVHDLEGRDWAQVYADPDFDQDHAGWWGNSLPAH